MSSLAHPPASGTARTGTVAEALELAARALGQSPGLALAQARAILESVPGEPRARLIEARALHATGQLFGAREQLLALAGDQPRSAATALELGVVANALGETGLAIASLRSATRLKPGLAPAWVALSAALRADGDPAHEREAAHADLEAIRAATTDPLLLRAATAMTNGDMPEAEGLLRQRLKADPADAAAARMLAELAWRIGRLDDAIALLEHAVRTAPGFDAARAFLGRLLSQANRLDDALAHAAELVRRHPADPDHAMLQASLMVRVGDLHGARAIYQRLVAEEPGQPRVWLNLGHVLKTLGERQPSIAAYREAIALSPTLGEAWWSLANLKTVKLGPDDIAAMRTAIATVQEPEDAWHLHFALGKALEDSGDAQAAFDHYDRANRLRRAEITYDADQTHADAQAHVATFTPALLAERAGQGCPSGDPIFILGLPRAGSTLVEQILASHSAIEGTMELPEMMMIASRLQGRVDSHEFASFGDLVAALSADDLAALGEEYIERTRIYRKTGRPRFIDKMPNNWQHVGLIRLVLPNARIIDARRHPMACCFSGWKQHFARGQLFSYDLADIGRYYRDYTEQMAAFEQAAPGAVYRLIHEDLVHDTPGEVRRLLDWLGLPFEDACLAFWKNPRAVRTASSEQVRQPITTAGLEQWRASEAWLGPLREALGPALENWRD